jgi:ferrous iron transport protein B
VSEAADRLAREFADAGDVPAYTFERALFDLDGQAEQHLVATLGQQIKERIDECRSDLSPDKPLPTLEAESRYRWINSVAAKVESRQVVRRKLADRIAAVTDHPFVGVLLFVFVMALVFQAVFAGAAPMMEAIDWLAGRASGAVAGSLPPGPLTSLITDGVIAGVGSVLVFLPQIIILFAFIILLEDSGYMARAAFLMDRAMRACGLSGQSFIPMLSSFACAVPGIMATRVIPSARDRLATILAAPFMTCSARLPVYALLIAAFVPGKTYFGGLVSLHGLVLLGLYFLGIAGGVLTAAMLKKTLLRGPTPSFLIELPPYRLPDPRTVGLRLLDRAKVFLRRAGTVIFGVAVVVWA